MEEKIKMKSLYIPTEIMDHMQEGKITMQEALTLSIIDFLDSKGECYASNEFIGNSLGLKKRRTTEIITSLENKGYISRTVIYKAGTNEVDKRILKPKIKTTKVELPSAEKCRGVVQNPASPSAEKCDIEKSREKSENNNICSISDLAFTKIFNLWNSKNIIKHKKVTDNMVRAYKKALKTYTDNEIVEAIENYNKCLNDDKFYYSHKFTLENFLKQSNGMSNFTSEGQEYINYLNQSSKASSGTYKQVNKYIQKVEVGGWGVDTGENQVNKKAPTGAGTQNKNNNVNPSICTSRRKYTQACDMG